MPDEGDRRDPNNQLGRELSQILKRMEEAPVPDEIRGMAKKLQDALKKQKRDK